MRHTRLIALLAALVSLPTLAACGDDPTGQRPVPGDQLVFLRAAENAPPLATTEVSFWATKGEDSEVEIRYANGAECLEFRVRDDALLRRPDGSTIAEGDSVRITVRVLDPSRFIFEFLPAGLVFDRREPAELRISYKYADRDFDDDGVIDDDDTDFDFAIWRQERDNQPWFPVGTARLKDLEELRAEISGFTRYAAAGE